VGISNFDFSQILLIRRVEHCQILVEDVQVFFFKNLSVLTENFVAVLVILTVLCNLVYEEQRQRFDTHFKQFFFFLEVGLYGFSDLNTTHILLDHITDNLALMNNCAIGKGYDSTNGINVGNNKAVLVLLHLVRLVEKVVVFSENEHLSCVTALLSNLDFKSCHRRFLGRKNNILKIEVLVRSGQVLNLKAFYFDLLNELLVESIKSIQNIHKVVFLCVGCGIVQAEQRVKVFKCFLCNFTAHFLRLVKNDNRSICLDNINRSARTELVTLGIDNTSFLAFAVLFQRRSESLRVDNHYVDTGA